MWFAVCAHDAAAEGDVGGFVQFCVFGSDGDTRQYGRKAKLGCSLWSIMNCITAASPLATTSPLPFFRARAAPSKVKAWAGSRPSLPLALSVKTALPALS